MLGTFQLSHHHKFLSQQLGITERCIYAIFIIAWSEGKVFKCYPLQSQNMLFGSVSEWEMLCLEQNYISLGTIIRIALVENGSSMATISQYWMWRCHTKASYEFAAPKEMVKWVLHSTSSLHCHSYQSRDVTQNCGKQHLISRRVFGGKIFQIMVLRASFWYLGIKHWSEEH